MWPYLLMFMLPAWLAAQEPSPRLLAKTPGRMTRRIPSAWWWIMLSLSLLVGWRHQVGGDWFNYLRQFESATIASQEIGWWRNDPGYRVLEWTAVQMDWGVHGVNLLAATIFSYGLVRFCLSLPRPWLALSLAVPYLVIILGMGYTRQGIALGCVMAGLVALGQGGVLRFVVWAVLGATFHKSAVLLLPMAALAASQRRLLTALWVGVVVAVAYSNLLEESVQNLQSGYLEGQIQSEGALVRLLMNALPAGLLLWQRKRFGLDPKQERLWFWFSLTAFALLGWYFVSPSSTAVDRVGLYLLPLQLIVFSHLPEAMGRSPYASRAWVGRVLLYYACVELVWLNFATNAYAWLPYRFYPLVDLF